MSKTIIITGASSGIGFALAEYFGKKGNKVDDLIEQAFFFGDYSELRKIWNALRDDEKSEVETAE